MSYNYLTVTSYDQVALVTFSHPPHNFMNVEALAEVQHAFETLNADDNCRALVLASEGKVFCAGADFVTGLGEGLNLEQGLKIFYQHAMTLFDFEKPMIAAVQGAAVGAGFGLSLVADFRVSSAEATFSANFTRLGIHPGFGMSVTLPRLIGVNAAEWLFYTGRRINGVEAQKLGLVNQLVERENVVSEAISLAQEIAQGAPGAVMETKATMRAGLAADVRRANQREQDLQIAQMKTSDFREGVLASREKRAPNFTGR